MDYIYDCETFPNCFQVNVMATDGTRWAYEISDRANHSTYIVQMLEILRDQRSRMVGFNNVAFDYPILHMLYQMKNASAAQLYEKAMAIIRGDNWAHWVRPSDRIVQQIDLYKIHHFDNKARATSLKTLEFNMRMENVADLPFPVGKVLTPDEMDTLAQYCWNDVEATRAFYDKSMPMIAFREELTQKYQRDFLNHNDTKLGKDYFIMRLESEGVQCYNFGPDGREPLQTPRESIDLKDVIFPWIEFEHPKLRETLRWFKRQTITETKGALDKKVTVDGFKFVFGLGGIHGSIESEVVESDDDHMIIDLDVTSYYPSLAIANRLYPQHLGETFCRVYADLKAARVHYPKGTAENAMLKLALNGVYGDSNNPYSPFYDPLYTMRTTLNGQLLLCMLAEKLMAIDGLRLIQVNTDGLTVRVGRKLSAQVDFVRTWWEMLTGLELEETFYNRMFVRDVNNYIGEYENGKVKRKGAYEYKREWHQNQSALIVPMAAEANLLHGTPVREFVMGHTDMFDFMLRAKAPRGSRLVWVIDGVDHDLPGMTRYYVSQEGGSLVKVMPPLKKSPHEWRRINQQSGRVVTPCNRIGDEEMPSIDYGYYIEEVEKLVLGLC